MTEKINDEEIFAGIKTVKEARVIAKKFAKENHLTLGKYEDRGKSDGCFYFSASDPKLKGMYVGLPLHICVVGLTKSVYFDSF